MEEKIQKFIAWAPHMPECRMRHGESIDDCDCGLKALRQMFQDAPGTTHE